MTFTRKNLYYSAKSTKNTDSLAISLTSVLIIAYKREQCQVLMRIVLSLTCQLVPLLSRSFYSTLIRAGRRSGWNNVSTITNFIIYPNFVWNFRLLLVLPRWKTKSGKLVGYPRCLVNSSYLGTVPQWNLLLSGTVPVASRRVRHLASSHITWHKRDIQTRS